MSEVFVGIDTSNYTTSVCAIDEFGTVLHEARQVLTVPLGKRGLQQSQALYQHVTTLPSMLDDLRKTVSSHSMTRVAVSTRPRSREGSYMPVFQAGILVAHALAVATEQLLIETTHQAGHIAAGVATAAMPDMREQPFAVMHLSGGTTDVLIAHGDKRDFGVQEWVSGKDLHVGQMVDRIGVQLGYSFPAGKQLEQLALQVEEDREIPVIPSSVQRGVPSFSGPLTHAGKLIEAGVEPMLVASGVFRCIGNTVEKMIRHMYDQTGIHRILLVGGVASSVLLKERLCNRFDGAPQQLYFCDSQYSSDNSFGVAHIAKNTWNW